MIRWDGVVVRVVLAGDLDVTTAPALTSSLREVAAARPERVVLDLAGLAFIDVAGARALDRGGTSLSAGCPVIVRPPRPPARRVLDLLAIGPDQGPRLARSSPVRSYQPLRPQSPGDAGGNVPGSEPVLPAVSAMPAAPRPEPAAERLALLSRMHAERDRAEDLYARAQAAMAWSHALLEASGRIRRGQGRPATWPPESLERSPYARLMARAASMPVIEQAKGIVMARVGCGDELAFDMLRRASQRMNVPVRTLAAQIVARTAHRGD